MHKLLKLFGKAILWLLALVVLYVGVAVVLSLIPTSPDPVSGIKDRRVYISSNGVHTDFILPVELVPPGLIEQLGYLADYQFLAFGWGDKGFYLDTPTWSELRASVAIRAMLLPSPTAVHVTGLNTVKPDWAAVDLTEKQVKILNDFIGEAFSVDATGGIVHIDDSGYGDNDEFYDAMGSYNALYTCNNWVNDCLKRMSVRTARWSPSAWGIMRWL